MRAPVQALFLMLLAAGLNACRSDQLDDAAWRQRVDASVRGCVGLDETLANVQSCLRGHAGEFFGSDTWLECRALSAGRQRCRGIVLELDWRDPVGTSRVVGWRNVEEVRPAQSGWIPP